MSKRFLMALILILIIIAGIFIYYLNQKGAFSGSPSGASSQSKKTFTASRDNLPYVQGQKIKIIEGDPSQDRFTIASALYGYVAGAVKKEGDYFLIPIDFPLTNDKKTTVRLNLGMENAIVVVAPAKNGSLNGPYQTQPKRPQELSSLLKNGDPVLIDIYYQLVGQGEYPNCEAIESCRVRIADINGLYENNSKLINALNNGVLASEDLEVGPTVGLTVYVE